jgi:hypothetical protein
MKPWDARDGASLSMRKYSKSMKRSTATAASAERSNYEIIGVKSYRIALPRKASEGFRRFPGITASPTGTRPSSRGELS